MVRFENRFARSEGEVETNSPIASCHCGSIRLELARPPETVTDCNCSLCRRYGVLWAYYSRAEVSVRAADEAFDSYAWGDHSLEFRRCKGCGCVTHWWPVAPGAERLGVNARLLPLELLARARVRRLDGAVTWRYLDE